MVVYTDIDIEADLDGDIKISDQGDIKIANPLETYKSAANFLLRTDKGDYAPDFSVGCNLGTFVGRLNSIENRESMQYNINSTLQEELFNISDVRATVVPFDMNEVLCVITIGGAYLIDNTIQYVDSEPINYLFPYIDGAHVTPITLS